jgi:hypothetical protein
LIEKMDWSRERRCNGQRGKTGRKWGKKRDRNRRKEGLEPGGEEKLKERVKRAGVV